MISMLRLILCGDIAVLMLGQLKHNLFSSHHNISNETLNAILMLESFDRTQDQKF